MVQDLQGNFAKFRINFIGSSFTLNQTADAIQPDHWVWTYFIRNGFFPYLKWPLDFQILSIGLLDVKTLPVSRDELVLNVKAIGNCSITLGSNRTTWQMGYAFRDLTEEYLLPIHEREFSYSYWCYTKEVPRVKQTLAYKLGIHLGSPVQFSRYNCCRTYAGNVYNRSSLYVKCIDQIPRMFQISFIPYLTGLIALAYFPILLFTIFGQVTTRGHYGKSTWTPLEDNVRNWVFLNEKPPINFTSLTCGLCGLAGRYSNAVSRFRRVLFLFVTPLCVYLQIYVYWKYMYETVMTLLEHGKPMQFLSLIGGANKSMGNFAPIFGGPPCLLVVYYVAGIIFVLIPKNINDLVQTGCARNSKLGKVSPLFFTENVIIKFSGIRVQEYFGYSKAAAIFRAGIYMLVNRKFWFAACAIHIRRIGKLLRYVKECPRPLNLLCLVLCAILLPVYVCLCVFELVISIVYYGVPVFSCICIMAKAYARGLQILFEKPTFTEVGRLPEMIGTHVIKCFMYVVTFCLFMYFTVSISAILMATFNFLGQVIILCFISAIVYPSIAFGYTFFTIIILYYIVKQLEKFGEGYFELLSMAVEICCHMEEDIFHARIENDIIVINKTNGAKISKLRVHDQMINLSTDLRNQIENVRCPQHRRIMYRNNMIGIPRDLFDHLVNHFRPVHVQVFHAILRLVLIAALVAGTVSLVLVKPFGPREDLSEVLHIIFIMVIGALPKILEIAVDKSNHIVKEDLRRAQMKALIVEFWSQKDIANLTEV